MITSHWLRRALIIVAAASVLGCASAQRSVSYEVESASVADHGTISDGEKYHVTSQIKTSGFSEEITASDNYQILPVSVSPEDASVNLWMLY